MAEPTRPGWRSWTGLIWSMVVATTPSFAIAAFSGIEPAHWGALLTQ